MIKHVLRAWMVFACGLALGPASAEEAPTGWQGFLVAGLTKGGDPIFTTITVDTGGVQHIYAGNLVQFGVGALWTARNVPFALALSANYHTDDATGANGSAQFKRVPIEAIGYYLDEGREWRVGVGMRYVTNPRLDSKFENDGATSRRAYRFKDARGVVVETGWRFGASTWLNLRVVSEFYEPTSATINGVYTDLAGSDKINGSHVGVNLLYAF